MQELRRHDTGLAGAISGKKKAIEAVPVVEVIETTVSPLEAYLRLKKPGSCSFLLESAELGGKSARYSFVGSGTSSICVKDGRIMIDGEEAYHKDGPLGALKAVLSSYRPGRPVFIRSETFNGNIPPMPPFYGGLAGYVSYDFVRYFDNIGDTAEDDMKFNDLELTLAGDMVAFDHVASKALLISTAFVDGDRNDRVMEAMRRVRKMNEAIDGGSSRLPEVSHKETPLSVRYPTGKERFEEMVTRAREYILDGDAFQIVLSQRAEVEGDFDPVALYLVLKSINPSPYMYFLEFGDSAIVGSSPEIMAKVEGRTVTVRPIAGTRPTGKTPEEDARLEAEMKADPKEVAEHTMLVDLGRNDIGKVSKFGSVVVNDFMGVEKYSHVQHIVSNVIGELDDGRDAADVLAATFPAGTVSGAPKTRAMQIIEELEGRRRGLYAGCVGYFGFNGNSDLAIAIRTVLLKDGKAYVQSGAGIVMDSVPEYEYRESINKAAAMIKALSRSVREE